MNHFLAGSGKTNKYKTTQQQKRVVNETRTVRTLMDRKVHIYHQMAGVKSLNVVAGYFLFLMNSGVVYVDLNHNTVFRLREVLHVLSVTCEVTGSSLHGGREEWLAGTVVQEARAASQVLSSLPKKSALRSIRFCSCRGRQVLGNCVPLPCIGATFWLGEVICFRM